MNTSTWHRPTPILLLLLLPGLLLLAPAPAGAQDGVPPTWDHYKTYEVLPPNPVGFVPLTLTDQFLTGHFTAIELVRFMNPTQKTLPDGTTSDIYDPRLHYTWWTIDEIPFSRLIIADNQFGEQTLEVRLSRFLLNPALKNERGTPPPANHYLCYDCIGDPVNVPVTMDDQFGTWNADVLLPRWFCNPVEKVAPEASYPIFDEKQHYVCYEFLPEDIEIRTATVTDQFIEDFLLTLSPSRFLCVPSFKMEPTATSGETWGRLKVLYR